MNWLQDKFSLTTPPIGMFVITGTPGIGKSVFLAYMVAFLVEKGYGIVIQIGQKFWSRQSGSGKTVAHREDKPFLQLEDAKVVLLADPLGGEDTKVEHRRAGCTIVFTSLRERCYKVSFKQQSPYSERRYMPIWSREELVRHRKVLFPTYEEKDVINAHALLGGSVRWLADLVKKQARVSDQSEAAQELIDQYLSIKSFEELNLLLQHFENPQNAEDRANSKMSYLLQIHAEQSQLVPFEKPTVRLIDSKVAVQVICEKLNLKTEEEQKKFVAQYLGAKPLGSLVEQVFQSFVLECLTGKGKKKYDLHGSFLGSKETFKVAVPNQRKELQTEAAGANKEFLAAAQLYHPLADNFPAADFFFLTVVSEEYTLWLLQTTKADKHDCKIGKMREVFEKHFDKASLEKVSTIKWVIVAPEVIASNYKKPQTVHGEWKIGSKAVEVEQYVSSWKVSPWDANTIQSARKEMQWLKTVCCVDELFLTTRIDTSIFLINVSMFFPNLNSMSSLRGRFVATIFVIRFFPQKLFGKIDWKIGWKNCWKICLENLLEMLGGKCWMENLDGKFEWKIGWKICWKKCWKNMLEMLGGNVGWKFGWKKCWLMVVKLLGKKSWQRTYP